MRRALITALVVTAALLCGASPASAHPLPHSVVLLDVHETSVTAHLQLPAGDLELARRGEPISAYLAAHITPVTTDGRAWTVAIGDLAVGRAEQTSTGPYQEVVATATLTPPPGGDLRHFIFSYDVIVHQVVTHTVLVSVRQDWAAGRVESEAVQVGAIAIDSRTMTCRRWT
ncbi:hypothetical protein [Actinoplanes palleronii]|uniref:Uncharacterized protein n=1 Tax=Actinoplanes palleronii TaxID=113570 RepID=A0ABQ4BTU9_9ACTN|nr:hypothetical protein [Actinoplanes palleronii]GIE73615.1 hypothetical protein Apa02nite_097230 [Actinoplanes palleronii]